MREGAHPGDLGQPPQGDPGRRPEEADRGGAQPARGGQAARRLGPTTEVRAVALHPDVIVVTSRVWQTTCTIVRGPATEKPHEPEAFVIDSPVYPDELELLPALLEQAAFPFSGLLATHGDWDHLLGRLAFPDAALGCAESTATRLNREPGAAQRALRDFDDEH